MRNTSKMNNLRNTIRCLLLAVTFISRTSLGNDDLTVISSTVTNGLSICIRDVYLRAGKTNLVRRTLYKEGKQILCAHRFYHRGISPGHFIAMENSWFLHLEANSPYSMSMGSGPSTNVIYVMILNNNGTIGDKYIQDDGVFRPVVTAELSELNAVF